MAEGHTRSTARVELELGPVPPVVGTDSRLVQVLLNLLVNAAQAIPGGRAALLEMSSVLEKKTKS